MSKKEMGLRGKTALITYHHNDSLKIECDGLNITAGELVILELRSRGRTVNEIAQEIGLTPNYVRIRLLKLHKKNAWIGPKDSHHIRITQKARDLELFSPLATLGFQVLLENARQEYRAYKATKEGQRSHRRTR